MTSRAKPAVSPLAKRQGERLCTSEELRKRAALQVSSFSEISPPALQGASFAQISPKVAPMPIGYRKAAKN
eukprot:g81604.t1